ncbi:MAG: aminotransferase class IV [Clostridia bacterium]|nr:aminotransferase class IV [Clostridia bacterium]
MKELGYYNGRIGELSEMTVPMNDRACWFGDGVYDAEMVRNRRLFALDEHVDRFFRSAAALRIVMPVTKEELKKLLNELVQKTESGNLFAYYQVTRGGGPRNHVFPEGPGHLWVTLTPREVNEGKTPVDAVTAEDTRFFHCDIKTINLIPSVMASQKAKEAGCHECILYRPGGRITECSHSNIHILKDGVLRTAPTDHLILPGIARARMIGICGELQIPVDETPFSITDLMQADEVIATSSSNLCVRIKTVDGQAVGMKAPELYEAIRSAVLAQYYRETDIPAAR